MLHQKWKLKMKFNHKMRDDNTKTFLLEIINWQIIKIINLNSLHMKKSLKMDKWEFQTIFRNNLIKFLKLAWSSSAKYILLPLLRRNLYNRLRLELFNSKMRQNKSSMRNYSWLMKCRSWASKFNRIMRNFYFSITLPIMVRQKILLWK